MKFPKLSYMPDKDVCYDEYTDSFFTRADLERPVFPEIIEGEGKYQESSYGKRSIPPKLMKLHKFLEKAQKRFWGKI